MVTSELSPARLDEIARHADVPRVIDNLDAGMGFSRRVESVSNGYGYCLPGYTRAPGGILCPAGKVTEIPMPTPGPSWAPAGILESTRFRGDIHLLTQGRHQLAMAGGTGNPGTVADGGAGFVGRGMAIFNNRLYVGGDTGLMYRDGSTGVWASPTTAVARAQLRVATWRPLGVPTQVLVGVAGASTIRWCPITADPLDDAKWSAPVSVGPDQQFAINQLVAAPRHVYMARADGVYDMDELGSRAFNIAPWLEEGRDINNGLWAMHVGQNLYYGHVNGVAVIPTSGEAQYEPAWATPGWGLPYEGPVGGHPTAGTLHDGWRLVGLTGGITQSESYVVAGLPSDQAYGAATHVWHGAEAIVPGRMTHMKVHQTQTFGGWPSLLMATSDGGSPPVVRLFSQSLPKFGTPVQELLLNTPFVPADAASLVLPADPWDRPSSVKTLLQFELLTERLTTANIVKLYAGADEGGYTEQGATVEGTYSAFAPLELTEGRYIKTRVDLLGSPILRSVELRAAVGIDLREARVYKLIIGYDNALKTPRGRETRDPEQRMMDLKTMVGRVVMLEDEVTMRVRVLQVMAPERRQVARGARAGAWALVVPLTVSILDHSFRYDGAGRYDTDSTWG